MKIRPILCLLGLHKKRKKTATISTDEGIVTERSVLVSCDCCKFIVDSWTHIFNANP